MLCAFILLVFLHSSAVPVLFRHASCLQATGKVQEQLESMKAISRSIAEGADAFLLQEFRYIFIYIVVFAIVLGLFIGPSTALLTGYL